MPRKMGNTRAEPPNEQSGISSNYFASGLDEETPIGLNRCVGSGNNGIGVAKSAFMKQKKL